MVDAIKIDEVNSAQKSVPHDFANLSDLESYRNAAKKKDIQAIILEVSEKDQSLQWSRKVTNIETRYRFVDASDKVSQEKVDTCLNQDEIKVKSLEVSLLVIGAIGHGTFVGNIFQAIGNSSQLSSYQQKKDKSIFEMLDHRSMRLRGIVEEQSKSIHQIDQEHQKDSSLIDRIIQTNQRMIETIFGGG